MTHNRRNDDCPLFAPRAHARSTDPTTSHAAAASISAEKIRASQRYVLDLFERLGPMTGDELARADAVYGEPPQSPSGLRTRRSELVEKGLLRDSGRRARLRSGKQAIVWEVKR